MTIASEAPCVSLAAIPIATLCVSGMRCVAVNRPYTELMGFSEAEVIGRSLPELVDLASMRAEDGAVQDALSAYTAGERVAGQVWCEVTDKAGCVRQLRVRWTQPDTSGLVFVFLLDASVEMVSRSLAESLARAGGELVRCRDEDEVLTRAAEALYAQRLSVTIMLLDGDAEELRYGPSRHWVVPELRAEGWQAIAHYRPPRSILEKVNPRFGERRARYVQDASSTIDEGFPAMARPALERLMAGSHLVQAPLFVEGEPYGALIVQSPELSPSRAATIEMFAELVARAIESVRSQRRAVQRLEELQRLQAELLERERLVALGEAAAVMAHEVRNPIAAISNALAVLRRHAPGSSESTEMLRVIGEEAERLERVVRDLLDLGRPLSPRRQLVDLGDLAIECVRTIRDRRGGDGAALAVRADGEALASIDPDQLQLALLNVVQNALQVSPREGSVIIDVCVDGRSDARLAVLSVEDQGPGFSDELVRRMFEPFFTTRPSGTGIGLAVVRRVVEANGGTIALGRGALGGGRFEIRFPAESAPPPSVR
jgi:signal transduction histidine kinase